MSCIPPDITPGFRAFLYFNTLSSCPHGDWDKLSRYQKYQWETMAVALIGIGYKEGYNEALRLQQTSLEDRNPFVTNNPPNPPEVTFIFGPGGE